jgi:hypothetical protein
MSLEFQTPRSAPLTESTVAQRLWAGLGLAGLVLAWAVVLLPCTVWVLGSIVMNWFSSPPVRRRASV